MFKDLKAPWQCGPSQSQGHYDLPRQVRYPSLCPLSLLTIPLPMWLLVFLYPKRETVRTSNRSHARPDKSRQITAGGYTEGTVRYGALNVKGKVENVQYCQGGILLGHGGVWFQSNKKHVSYSFSRINYWTYHVITMQANRQTDWDLGAIWRNTKWKKNWQYFFSDERKKIIPLINMYLSPGIKWFWSN